MSYFNSASSDKENKSTINGSGARSNLNAGTLGVPKRLTEINRKPAARLKPGFSTLDWALLKNSGKDLRGVDTLGAYTLEEVAKHNTRDDCWMILYGKVYNVTAYLPYHPGGKGQVMRAAGKDGTKLFAENHAWVNPELMLDKCLVGFLKK